MRGLGVSKTAITDALKSEKWKDLVLFDLSDRQKSSRLEVCPSSWKNDLFLDRGITRDGRRVLCDNQRRSGEWGDEPHALPQDEIPPEEEDGNNVVVGSWRFATTFWNQVEHHGRVLQKIRDVPKIVWAVAGAGL